MKVLVQAPVFTSSGYGEHSRLLMQSLLSLGKNKIDLFLDPLSWGNTSWIMSDSELEKKCHELALKNSIYKESEQGLDYDVQIHVGLPNEFTKLAPFSVLVTAGIETDRVSPEWLSAIQTRGINKIIVPSEHSKAGFANTAYIINSDDHSSNKTLECTVDIDVVPYPVKEIEEQHLDLNLNTDFNFLSVAMMTPRKNLSNTLKWFLEEFKDNPNVGLVLKTGLGKSTNIDRTKIYKSLKKITSKFENKKCKVYLLHGNLSEGEMKSLYQNPKIKALISTTHGEGFGLPLFEAASYGLPVIATDWSAHTEFLKAEVSNSKKASVVKRNMFCAVDYELKPVQKEAVWKGIITEDSKWAYPMKGHFKSQLRKVKNNYKKHKDTALILKDAIVNTYTQEKVYQKMLDSIFGEDMLSVMDLESIKIEDIPKISIITSVYNGDDYIQGFMDDITSQNIFKEKCELIMINANSPGNEEKVILEFQKKFPNNIKYKKLEEDPGIYGTWNVALSMATGEFITNANLDDRKSPESILAHAEELVNNPEVDLVYSDMLITKETNETWSENSSNGEKYTMPNFSLGALKMVNMPHAAPMWRKSLHDKYGVFDDSFKSAGDWEMWLRAASRGSRFKKIDGFYNLYCFNPKGVSTNPDNFSWKEEEERRVYEKYNS